MDKDELERAKKGFQEKETDRKYNFIFKG